MLLLLLLLLHLQLPGSLSQQPIFLINSFVLALTLPIVPAFGLSFALAFARGRCHVARPV